MAESKTVGAVDRTALIIEAVRELRGARVSELSDHLEITESSIHSHLTTLQNAGYIVKQGDVYDISLKVLRLSRYAKRRNSTFQAAKPVVDKLALETGEVASLLAEDQGVGYFVYGRKGPDTSQPSTEAREAELHAVAPGKAILAHYPRERVEEIISNHGLTKRTANTITDKEELFEELEEIQSRGVAFNRGEYIEGLRSVGVPVKGKDGRVVAALSIYGPAHSLQGEFFEREIPELLLASANDVHLEVRYGND